MKRATAALAAVAATLLVAACNDDDADKLVTQPKAPTVVTAPAETGPPAPAAATTPPSPDPAATSATPKPAAAKVGDTITINGSNEGNRLDATVVKIVDPASTGSEYTIPKAGYRFIAVQWRITNTGARTIDVGPMIGSSIIDADGQQFSPTYQQTTAGPLYPTSATIPVGSSRLGFLMYEVPTASKIREIQFDPSMGMGSQIGQWIVS